MADELIRLDKTIVGIDALITKAETAAEAYGLFKAKDVIYSQQRYFADVQPVKREVVKITDSDFMLQGYLTIEKFYSCPRCGESFCNVRFSKKSQLADVYKYCYKCGQGLDWADATKG